MATVIVESYMFRYPLGGMVSWVLQYLVGLQRLGVDVYFVERADHACACFDPERGEMTDDCSYALRTVGEVLRGFGLESKWCFVDYTGIYHGLSARRMRELFRSSDVIVDMTLRPSWTPEAAGSTARVLIDGDPGFRQMWMAKAHANGEEPWETYDFYFTTGRNVGTDSSSAPTAGIAWRPMFHPVVPELFDESDPAPDAPFTTVMNWRSYEPVEYDGTTYGHKDEQFAKFLQLPRLCGARLEVAVAGPDVPRAALRDAGWKVSDAHAVTASFDAFKSYIRTSRGEFSVCKGAYVATNSGWFSDRSGAYLASGRPVVLQDTGFSAHLPSGEGLVAVRCQEEAAAAIEEVCGDYPRHARAAREIAAEYLAAEKVLGRVLSEIGL